MGVRVAVCQFEPRIGEAERNRRLCVEMTQAAVGRGAQLVVLPELASSGDMFSDRAEAEALAEDAHDGPTVSALAEACGGDTHVVVGICERDGDALHNAAVLVGTEGTVAVQRKLHLYGTELEQLSPGAELVLAELSWGRLGMLVCYDLWFPEVATALALAGADLLAVPANLLSSNGGPERNRAGQSIGDVVAMATASQNAMAVALADRTGTERGTHFHGASLISSADGWPLAGPAAADTETILTAEIEIDAVRAARRRGRRNHLLDDRRPDLYASPVQRIGGVRSVSHG